MIDKIDVFNVIVIAVELVSITAVCGNLAFNAFANKLGCDRHYLVVLSDSVVKKIVDTTDE